MKRSRAQIEPTLVAFSLSLLLATAAQAQGSGTAASYRIGPMDLVSVEVLEDDSLDAETRVTEAGTIELPHVDPVTVAGLTASEAAQALGKALEKYLQRATVTLRIVEYRSQPITLLGALRTPGTLPFSGRWTLIDALTQAGGLTGAAGGNILVLRRASNGLSDQILIDRRELLERGNADLNIPLFPNDLINVPVATDITVFLIGEVASPGAVVFRSTDRITLLAALARAGGLTGRASNKVLVRRFESGAELRVNYKKLLAGSQPDVELSDGDLIIVKESFF
ncbi:MAG: polysaccharide biosynthesis/export family protein [Acidobacteria bacterium]|nr:polysaccharide biosynthesis/export family protein [Acidobacteriota bacterium]